MTATAAEGPAAYAGRWRNQLLEVGGGRQPQWWLAVAAGLGWVLLATLDVAHLVAAYGSDGAGHGGHRLPRAGAGASPTLLAEWAAHGGAMVAMLAVMAPLVARNVRYAALRAPAADRATVVRWVTGGWAATWGVLLLLLAGVAAIGSATIGAVGTTLLATAAAVAWQWTPWKRVGLARCHRVVAPPLPRPEAGVTCRRYGARLGWSCAVSCGPMMLLMMAGGHRLVVVAPLVAVAWHERRRRPHHDPARGATSWVITLAGAAATASAGLG